MEKNCREVIEIVICNIKNHYIGTHALRKACRLLKVSSETIHKVCKANGNRVPNLCIKGFIVYYRNDFNDEQINKLMEIVVQNVNFDNVPAMEGKNNIKSVINYGVRWKK